MPAWCGILCMHPRLGMVVGIVCSEAAVVHDLGFCIDSVTCVVAGCQFASFAVATNFLLTQNLTFWQIIPIE